MQGIITDEINHDMFNQQATSGGGGSTKILCDSFFFIKKSTAQKGALVFK
jgi:hypothetical protein